VTISNLPSPGEERKEKKGHPLERDQPVLSYNAREEKERFSCDTGGETDKGEERAKKRMGLAEWGEGGGHKTNHFLRKEDFPCFLRGA